MAGRVIFGLMPKALKITIDVLLVLVPLAVVIYFLAYPDRFDAFLNWVVRR